MWPENGLEGNSKEEKEKKVIELQDDNFGFGLLFDMGCGKTLTSISIIGAAYQKGFIKRVLIIAPSSVVAVWPKEFKEYAAFPNTVVALLSTKAKREKELKNLMSLEGEQLKVAVINYESVWRKGIKELLVEFEADMIICDESQRIKTHNAMQSKAVHELGDKARYKLILSGTPVQNEIIDLYSQYRFLDPKIFGTNFYEFRNTYCQMGGFNNKQIVGYRNLKELTQKEHSIAYRVTKDEALDLPEQIFETRYISLSSKTSKLYNKLKEESVAELENEEQVTATTVLTKLLRLQQLCGGFLQTDESDTVEQVGTEKLEAIKDIVEDYVLYAGKKLVIFARFVPEVLAIKDTVDKLLKNKKSVCLYGDTKKTDRGKLVQQFQEDKDTVVFIGQIDTAGTGITLTAADTCVYYSKNFNYATYSQSLSRIHRIGQKNRCTYIDLLAEGTVDEKINQALMKKEGISNSVVNDWRKYF